MKVTLSDVKNNYTTHPLGNYALCGLNMLGPQSTILWKNNVYTFKYFGITGSPKENLAYYESTNCKNRWFTYAEIRESVRLQKPVK